VVFIETILLQNYVDQEEFILILHVSGHVAEQDGIIPDVQQKQVHLLQMNIQAILIVIVVIMQMKLHLKLVQVEDIIYMVHVSGHAAEPTGIIYLAKQEYLLQMIIVVILIAIAPIMQMKLQLNCVNLIIFI